MPSSIRIKISERSFTELLIWIRLLTIGGASATLGVRSNDVYMLCRCSTLTLIAPDRPALTGFQNFAVGVKTCCAVVGFSCGLMQVRRDQEVLWRTLSFWINSLRTCSPYSVSRTMLLQGCTVTSICVLAHRPTGWGGQLDSACYLGRPWAVNLATLFDSWFAPDLCPAVKLETE